jgi:hypothetical protein
MNSSPSLSQIITSCLDGVKPSEQDAYYAILCLHYLLTKEHEQLSLVCQSCSIGRPPSTVRAREIINKSDNSLKAAGIANPQVLLGPKNDPQTPEFQEKRRAMKAEAARGAVAKYRERN